MNVLCIFACMDVRMYVRMSVCLWVRVCVHVYECDLYACGVLSVVEWLYSCTYVCMRVGLSQNVSVCIACLHKMYVVYSFLL